MSGIYTLLWLLYLVLLPQVTDLLTTAVVVILLAGLWFWARPAHRLLSAVLLVGLVAVSWQAYQRLEQKRLSEAVEGVWILNAELISTPEPGGDPQRLLFRLSEASGLLPAGSLLRLSWYRAPELEPYSHWRLQVKLSPARGLLNHVGWDYEAWLFRQGIDHRGWVKHAEALPPLPCAWRCHLARWRYDSLLELQNLDAWRQSGLLLALGFGERRLLSDSAQRLFAETGLAHALAISGLHIGIAALAFATVAGGLWRLVPGLSERCSRGQLQAVFALFGAVLYAALAGFSLPTQRAVIAVAVVSVCRVVLRFQSPWQWFQLALIGVLWLEPVAVMGAGFWLSFGAVACLLWLMPLWQHRPRWLQLVGMQLALSALGFVAGGYFFSQGAWLSPLVNLLFLPLLGTVIVPLLLLGVLLLQCGWQTLARWPLQLADRLLDGTLEGLLWLQQQLPTLALSVSLQWGHMALMVLGLFVLGLPVSRAFKLSVWLPLCLIAWLSVRLSPPRPFLQLDVLDVGQGTAVLVQTQHHALAYDLGPPWRAAASALPALAQARRLDHLDAVIVSHSDNDHQGGLAQLRQSALSVGRWYASSPLPGLESWDCQVSTQWQWDGVRFALFQADRMRGDNNRSCVLLIEPMQGLPEQRVLLAGDIEAPAERQLLAQGRFPRVGGLLAPHHGSKTSSTPAFLQALAPRWVVFSRGYANRFGFVHPEVLERYTQRGVLRFDTACQGGVRLWLDHPDSDQWQWQVARSLTSGPYWRNRQC